MHRSSPSLRICPRTARLQRALLGLGGVWLALALVLAWLDREGRWIDPGRETVVLVKLWIFWAVWAVIPWCGAAMLGLRQPAGRSAPRLAWLGALALVAYSGLVEPRLLTVREHRLPLPPSVQAQPLRLALVADVHAGLFMRGWQIERLVDRLNALDVDAVVVAGDWTYEPPRDLHVLLAPFARLRHPVWGVLGNHDTGAPGPPLAAALRQALQGHGVQLLEGQRLLFRGWEVLGLGDLWGGDPRGDVARLLPPGTPTVPRLVLAHQPDTAALLPAGSARLVLSGHTHGGQIMLPWITRHWVLPGMSAQGWFEGLNTTPAGPLFVTAGVGTIGLPARLAVVPRIDVLRIE